MAPDNIILASRNDQVTFKLEEQVSEDELRLNAFQESLLYNDEPLFERCIKFTEEDNKVFN